MHDVDGFFAAVSVANRQFCRRYCTEAALVFREHSALRVVDCWHDRNTLMEDPRMDPAHHLMTFDGRRMIDGGFAPLVDAGG